MVNYRQALNCIGWFDFSIVFTLHAFAAASEVGGSSIDSAQQYWRAFRLAAIQDKISIVADMISFPIEIRGVLDSSEHRQIARPEFIRLFPKLLKTDPGLAPTPTTMISLVNSTPQLSPSFFNSHRNQFRIGSWVFQLKPEGWRFVQAFIDE